MAGDIAHSQTSVGAAGEIAIERDRMLDAAERKVRSQRCLGALVQNAPLDRGGRPASNRSPHRTGSVTLGRLGFTKHQAADWRRLAAVPDDTFERYLAATRAAGIPATASGAMRAAKAALEPPTSAPNSRAADTRGVRKFCHHLNEARRLARGFGLAEIVTALAVTDTFSRDIEAIVDPGERADRATENWKGVTR